MFRSLKPMRLNQKTIGEYKTCGNLNSTSAAVAFWYIRSVLCGKDNAEWKGC